MATNDEKFPLHAAAFDPSLPDGVNLPKLREVLDQGANANSRDEHGRTALAVTHSVEAAQMLIDAGTGLDEDFYYSDVLRNERSPEFQALMDHHMVQQEDFDIARQLALADFNVDDGMENDNDEYRIAQAELGDERNLAAFEHAYDRQQAQELKGQQIGDRTSEQAQAPHEHQQLFDTFKAQVRGPAPQHEPTPLEQAQQARAPSLGSAAVSRNVELPNFRKQPESHTQDRVAPSRNVELPNFRKHAEPEQQKGARFVDLPLPQRGAQDREVSAGEAFNQETTRRASARMAPTLGQQAQATGYAPKAPEVEAQDQGQQGNGQGGRERPNDPSYYTQFSQSVALPKRDEQAAEKQAARRAVDRSRGRGLGGLGR